MQNVKNVSFINTNQVDEDALYNRVSEIIEYRKSRAGAYANREVTLMYWEVGEHINTVVLDGGRAAYGKNILSTLSTKLCYCSDRTRWAS